MNFVLIAVVIVSIVILLACKGIMTWYIGTSDLLKELKEIRGNNKMQVEAIQGLKVINNETNELLKKLIKGTTTKEVQK